MTKSAEQAAVERQEKTILNSLPVDYTATDPLGVERTIAPAPQGWKPAPLEPNPEEVARIEARTAKVAELHTAATEATKDLPDATQESTSNISTATSGDPQAPEQGEAPEGDGRAEYSGVDTTLPEPSPERESTEDADKDAAGHVQAADAGVVEDKDETPAEETTEAPATSKRGRRSTS